VLGFVLDMPQKPLRDTPRTVQLRLDGIAQPAIRFEMGGSVREWSLTTPEHQRRELAERLAAVSIVDLDFADASGAPLARFSFDVRRLRRVPEVLQSINWSCR
jgi:GTP-dependent phosphoenolpyruvate carboxykinase